MLIKGESKKTRLSFYNVISVKTMDTVKHLPPNHEMREVHRETERPKTLTPKEATLHQEGTSCDKATARSNKKS